MSNRNNGGIKRKPSDFFKELTGKEITDETTLCEIDTAIERARGRKLKMTHNPSFIFRRGPIPFSHTDMSKVDTEIDACLHSSKGGKVMGILKTLQRILFPTNLDTIFSEEAKEKTALEVACGRITTKAMFDAEMHRMEERVAIKKKPVAEVVEINNPYFIEACRHEAEKRIARAIAEEEEEEKQKAEQQEAERREKWWYRLFH